VAVTEWFSPYVLSWELSATLDTGFCLAALEAALCLGALEMFNTDQGSQFAEADCTGALQQRQIRISMDGRARWLAKVFIERLEALGELRTDLPGGLCRLAAAVDGAEELFPAHQLQPAASGAGLPDAGRGVHFVRHAAGGCRRLPLALSPGI